MKRHFPLILLALLLATLAACSNAGAGDPAGTVEKYLQAKVSSDADTLRSLLCADMESVLEREIHTFDSISDVQIEGMACTFDGDATVNCQGKIVALYGTEETEFPLTSYRVVQEDGEWKWCGEAGP
jgi:hypothetical protein